MLSQIFKKVVVSLVVVGMVVWAVHWAVLNRAVEKQDYGAGVGAKKLEGFAEAQYDFGIKAWYENRLDAAKAFFEQAVSINPFYVDAWLKLAEVRQAAGDLQTARKILLFTDRLAGDVVKWKWQQLLMARQLEMDEMFVENVNFVIPFRRLRDQALELVDMHYGQQAEKVLEVLEAENLSEYLRWLMRRERVEDSLETWAVLSDKLEVDPDLYERYINFLFRHKEIQAAVRIRKQYTGLKDEMTNPGFENQVSGNVFGWQTWSRKYWDVRRDRYQARQGNYALRVDFSGKENIKFYHVRQFVPVVPGKNYRLTFWWQSKNLTTDQRPYFEVRGVDCENGRWKTDMVARDSEWHEQGLEFRPADDCRAVMIRLRRNKSRRFDNKIDGTLWIDEFQIKTETGTDFKSDPK